MFLLKFTSEHHIKNIGIFDSEEKLIQWVEALPFITKIDDYDYEIQYKDFPPYYEHTVGDVTYPLTNLTFLGDIEIDWEEIPDMTKPGLADGVTLVDNYHFENHELKQYIEDRENLFNELKTYFTEKNLAYTVSGTGSEDGTYFSVEDHFFAHLDPSTVEERKNYDSIEAFVEAYN
ncbi:hypothetical protein ROU88_05850 [Macrococcus capreoli]|uniref:hypothetical protein n=1 Tax=Macrococcus capreoli TaxID=2982690 RepID=UPI0021D5BA17|nr:hypothetical protein [Macrococcus sp. TMW 2.2395]MCU7558231.1 hypothetical protein [Macrococcus sp. TMW 2.2395]